MVLMSKVLVWVISLVSTLAFIGIIICIATPIWDELTVDVTVQRVITTHTYSGIWSTCTLEEVKEHSTLDCVDAPDSDSLEAVRAMLLIGAITSAGVVVLLFLKGCCFSESKIVSIAIIVLSIASAILLVIGAVIYVEEVSVSSSELHVAFGICICAAILLAVVAVLMVVLLCCCDD